VAAKQSKFGNFKSPPFLLDENLKQASARHRVKKSITESMDVTYQLLISLGDLYDSIFKERGNKD
jgi:hypothetical protein